MPFDKFPPDLPVVGDESMRPLNARERAKQRIENDIEGILDEYLPEMEYISEITDPESGETYSVVDVDEVKTFLSNDFFYKGIKVAKQKIAMILFERHKTDKCISKDEWIGGSRHMKPLFYLPASPEAAVSSDSIRDEEFIMPLWELVPKGVLDQRDDIYPTQNGEEVSAFEARVAVSLFHPDYGAGYRDESGTLYVREKDATENDAYIPFGRKVLNQYGLAKILRRGKDRENRDLRTGMSEELPHLLKNGELRLSDVRETTIDRKTGKYTGEFARKTIENNGNVTIRGVRQYVGKRYSGMEIQPLGTKKALVFDARGGGIEKVVAIFSVVSKEESILDKNSAGDSVPRTNLEHTQRKEIKLESFLSKSEIADFTQNINELMQSAREAESLVNERVKESEESAATDDVRDDLLAQAERVIEDAIAAKNREALEKVVASSKADIRLYVTLFRKFGAEKMLSNPLREVSAAEISEEQKEQMLSILRRNYGETYPGEEYKEFRVAIEKSLRDSFEKSGTQFYILENAGKIVSFNRFDEVNDGRKILYFGSFNADPIYHGVGSAMLEHTIKEKVRDSDVMFAHCDPRMSITQKYIEDGFVAVQTETIAGNFSFEIWRTADIETHLQTKRMDAAELVAIAGQPSGPESDYFVREVKPDDVFEELDSGLPYLLTRYFTHEGKVYAAFELNTQLSHEFEIRKTSEQEAV